MSCEEVWRGLSVVSSLDIYIIVTVKIARASGYHFSLNNQTTKNSQASSGQTDDKAVLAGVANI